MLKLQELKCNYETEPVGVTGSPVFGWKYLSDQNETVQTEYELRIFRGDDIAYDSGLVRSGQSVCVKAEGFAPEPETEYIWSLRIRDNHGETAEADSRFEGAIGEWSAKWIEPSNGGVGYEKPINIAMSTVLKQRPKTTPEERLMPVTMLRKDFSVKPGLKKARAYATAHGIYQLQLNGNAADERRFAPEYSAYQKVLFYQIYDVTNLLREGANTVGALLADGWWGGRVGMSGECWQFGSTRAFLMELHLDYEDGSREVIGTDGSFRWSDQGEVRYADLFIGEMIDKRLSGNSDHFSEPDFVMDDSWTGVTIRNYGVKELLPQMGGKVLPFRVLKPKRISNPKGEQVLDFGQNFAGIVRCRISAPAGTRIKLEHAEMLNEKGNYFNNIFGVNKDQADILICGDGETEVFEPRFTFHGFRYVRVTGLGQVDPADFEGIALTTAMDDLADFTCSDPDLDQLYSNSRWSQYSNMISLPTDCPQREKAGWTGDIQIFAPTAAYHQDVDAFLYRWMKSVEAEQWDDGLIPPIIPYTVSYQKIMESIYHADSSGGWSDACIIVPWEMYQMLGDTRILADYYPVMQRWLEYVRKTAEENAPKEFRRKRKKTEREIDNQKYLWNTGFHFGDWLVPDKKEKTKQQVKGGETLFATMYYAFDAELMAKIAELLGRDDDANRYRTLYDRIREAFAEEYVLSDGLLARDTQGAYVCALWFDLIPEDRKEKAASRLKELIEANGGRLNTGFLATPKLLEVLSQHMGTRAAYDMLYQRDYPSWFYEIDRGATTIWEEWNAVRPNGKVGFMSFNHYAFGCVCEFLHQHIAGIRKLAPGYEKILIQPDMDRRITSAKGSYNSVYGLISCDWKKENGKFAMDVTIPCGTSAQIVLPNSETFDVGSGRYHYEIEL